MKFLRLLMRFFDQGGERERFLHAHAVAGEETHLIHEPGDALHAVGQRHVERSAELRVLVLVGEQLFS